MRPGDVAQTGAQGEVLQACAGSVVAEMLEKHPPAAESDQDLPDLDALLDRVQEGPGRGLRREQLCELVWEAFSDEMRFRRYVCRLPRLSMPGADQVRFEHSAA